MEVKKQSQETVQAMNPVVTLFLDFDGVLHPLHGGGARLQYAPLLVSALKPHPDVQIVLSTSWAVMFGLDETKNMLPTLLRQRVVGATYDPKYARQEWLSSMTRYTQIAKYVKRHLLTHWLAVDDDDEGWPAEHRKSLVRTSSRLGLAHPDTLPELADKLQRLQTAKQ